MGPRSSFRGKEGTRSPARRRPCRTAARRSRTRCRTGSSHPNRHRRCRDRAVATDTAVSLPRSTSCPRLRPPGAAAAAAHQALAVALGVLAARGGTHPNPRVERARRGPRGRARATRVLLEAPLPGAGNLPGTLGAAQQQVAAEPPAGTVLALLLLGQRARQSGRGGRGGASRESDVGAGVGLARNARAGVGGRILASLWRGVGGGGRRRIGRALPRRARRPTAVRDRGEAEGGEEPGEGRRRGTEAHRGAGRMATGGPFRRALRGALKGIDGVCPSSCSRASAPATASSTQRTYRMSTWMDREMLGVKTQSEAIAS